MNYFHAYIHKYKKRNKTYLEPKKKKMVGKWGASYLVRVKITYHLHYVPAFEKYMCVRTHQKRLGNRYANIQSVIIAE